MIDLFSKEYWNYRRYTDPIWLRLVGLSIAFLNLGAVLGSTLIFLGYYLPWWEHAELWITAVNLLFGLAYLWYAWPTLLGRVKEKNDE